MAVAGRVRDIEWEENELMACHSYRPFDMRPELTLPNCGSCGMPQSLHAVVVIVTGSRKDDVPVERIEATLDAISPRPRLLVQGGATGVDTMAATWARKRQVPCATHEAYWHHFTPRSKAGPFRNGEMLAAHPEGIVYAFPGPESRGTWDCVNQAKRLRRSIRIIQ